MSHASELSDKRQENKDILSFYLFLEFYLLFIVVVVVTAAVWMHDTVIWEHTCHGLHVEVRGQLHGVHSLLPPVHSFQGLNSGCEG